MTLKSLFRTFVTYDAVIYWTTTLVDILATGTVWWQLATTHGTAFFSLATTHVSFHPSVFLAGMTDGLIIQGGTLPLDAFIPPAAALIVWQWSRPLTWPTRCFLTLVGSATAAFASPRFSGTKRNVVTSVAGGRFNRS